MELSKRLSAVAAMVMSCDKMADIGTDHGYIPIYLIEQRRVKHALAMDINKGPLERAREHVKLHHLDEYIELRLSDGAEKLQAGEAETAVIAGMGGRLMMKIIGKRKEVFDSLQEFIIQPQSEYGFVRHFLEDNGFEILCENMVVEDGKYYPMMKVRKGRMHLKKEYFYEYGSFLLEEKNPVLYEYLRKENRNYKKIRETLLEGSSEKQKKRLLEIEKLLLINEEALAYYEKNTRIL